MKRAKRLVVGVLLPIEHPEPHSANDSESTFVVQQIFEPPLAVVTDTNALEPSLFREALESDDHGKGLRFRARVRDDIRFSDGVPMKTEDVAASLRASAVVAEQADVLVSGDVIRFELRHRNPRFELSLAHPKCSVVRRVGDRLLGTGPFLMHPDSVPEAIRLVRNPHHARPAFLDEVEIRAYELDEEGHATRLTEAVQRGEVDLCMCLARDDIAKLSGVRKSVQAGSALAMLFMNTERPALSDPRLRRAIAHSIDRFSVAKACFSNGLAFAASGLLPRTLGVADDDLVLDEQRARALLAEDGVVMPTRMRLLVVWGPRPYLPKPLAVARVLADQLAKLGCQVEIEQPASARALYSRLIDSDYDLMLGGWIADTLDPSDFLGSILASDRVPNWENLSVSANHGRWRSEALDAALVQYREERSTSALGAIVDCVNRDAPLVPLTYGAAVSAWSYRVRNFRATCHDGFSLGGIDVDA